MGTSYIGSKNGTAFIPTIAKPIDIRTVVDSIDDLTNGSIPQLYQGLTVNIKGTGDIYVLISSPRQAGNINNWKKVGYFDPSTNLEYYQEKLGIRVVSSVDELLAFDFENPYAGMLALVVDMSSESESEDESGLYILLDTPNTTYSNWMKIEIGDNKGNAPVRVDKISEEDILGLFE